MENDGIIQVMLTVKESLLAWKSAKLAAHNQEFPLDNQR
jgi:hypothetical protein